MFDIEYTRLVRDLLTHGQEVGPRGFNTRELLDQKFMIISNRNILNIPERHLNYRYLVAEWLWIMFGHSDVATIKQYNSQLKRFSDDGIYLTGAYGPHINAQWRRCREKLERDRDSRQAVLEIPRPWVETRDEPCTLSLQFLLRNGALHCITTMRSSDAWLGLPYDVFTFTQIQNCLAGELGVRRGMFTLNAGSSHLYETDFEKAEKLVAGGGGRSETTEDLPGRPPQWLDDVLVTKSLERVPETVDWDRSPWMPFARALCAPSWGSALSELTRLWA